MQKLITILYLFFSLITFGQENKLTESDLVGYWTFEHIILESDSRIFVYKRCDFTQKGTVYKFKSDGNFKIFHNWKFTKIHRPARCGNEIRKKPKSIYGKYSLSSELQQVKLVGYPMAYKKNWDLIWIDENSFGVKKPKHNNIYN